MPINKKLRKAYTGHLWVNKQKCKACWECIDACPKQVIGKVNFLWHKHIVLKKSENCSGCKKCLKVCQHGVFSEEMPDCFK